MQGYIVPGRELAPMLHAKILQHVTGTRGARSYDGLYEVISGTQCTPLDIDIEVGLLMLEQLKPLVGDAEFWW